MLDRTVQMSMCARESGAQAPASPCRAPLNLPLQLPTMATPSPVAPGDDDDRRLTELIRKVMQGIMDQQQRLRLAEDSDGSAMSPSQPRILIYGCPSARKQCGGLGDRMRGIVSSFVLAILSGRRFVVHFTSTFSGEEDFGDYLWPQAVDWRADAQVLKLVCGAGGSHVRAEHLINIVNFDAIPELKINPEAHMHAHGTDTRRRLAIGMDLASRWGEDEVVMVRTNRLLLPAIWANERLWQALPAGSPLASLRHVPLDRVFPLLMSLLFRPSPAMEQALAALVSQAGSRNRFLISLQFRGGDARLGWGSDLRSDLSHLPCLAELTSRLAAAVSADPALPPPAVFVAADDDALSDSLAKELQESGVAAFTSATLGTATHVDAFLPRWWGGLVPNIVRPSLAVAFARLSSLRNAGRATLPMLPCLGDGKHLHLRTYSDWLMLGRSDVLVHIKSSFPASAAAWTCEATLNVGYPRAVNGSLICPLSLTKGKSGSRAGAVIEQLTSTFDVDVRQRFPVVTAGNSCFPAVQLSSHSWLTDIMGTV